MARALVVDGRPEFADLLARQLRHRGHQARTLADGRQVPAVVAAFRPHAVYLSLSLAHRDGAAVAADLLATADRPRVVVVSGSDERRLELLAVGVDGFYVKPPRLEDLLWFLPAD